MRIEDNELFRLSLDYNRNVMPRGQLNTFAIRLRVKQHDHARRFLEANVTIKKQLAQRCSKGFVHREVGRDLDLTDLRLLIQRESYINKIALPFSCNSPRGQEMFQPHLVVVMRGDHYATEVS